MGVDTQFGENQIRGLTDNLGEIRGVNIESWGNKGS